MKVLLGLGNPGMTYHGTRHNVGFSVIQALADRHSVSLNQRLLHAATGSPSAVYGDCEIAGRPVRLVMNLTMMNEAGEALQALNVSAEKVLVVYDDIELPLGRLRLRPEGGSGGHNGMQSCLNVLNNEDLNRLRIGVGVDPMPEDLKQFVLGKFTDEEKPQIRNAVQKAADACETWIDKGIEEAMNRFNTVEEE